MRFSIGLILGLSSFLMIGCAWNKNEANKDGPFRVQIPFSIDGEYSLQIVDLFTLKNLPELQGLAARFLIDPDSVSGRLKGRHPDIRYIRDSNGVIVPKDDLSLQLLTVYAHYEKLKALDELAGAGEVLRWPQTVAVNVQFRSREGVIENNALYSGQYDSLLLVPYTKDSLPLMANGGVMGHEHFHAIFQSMVISRLKSKYPTGGRVTLHDEKAMVGAFGLTDSSDSARDSRTVSRSSRDGVAGPTRASEIRDQYHAVLMRGINEGLADVWGWVYTGDSVFVGRSLPQEKLRRALDVRIDQFFTQSELYDAIRNGEDSDSLLYRSYEHGTQLARSIRNFADHYSQQTNQPLSAVRKMVGSAVIQTLVQLKTDFENLKDDELFSLSRAAFIFSQQIKDLNSNQCFYFLKLMPAEDRVATGIGKACEKLKLRETGT